MSSGLFKNVISKMFKNHMYSLTNHIYNDLTMWKQIVDVKLNC